MKLIDADSLLSWLMAQQISLRNEGWEHLGRLFYTGSDVTYEKIIDYVKALRDEAD